MGTITTEYSMITTFVVTEKSKYIQNMDDFTRLSHVHKVKMVLNIKYTLAWKTST